MVRLFKEVEIFKNKAKQKVYMLHCLFNNRYIWKMVSVDNFAIVWTSECIYINQMALMSVGTIFQRDYHSISVALSVPLWDMQLSVFVSMYKYNIQHKCQIQCDHLKIYLLHSD